MKKDLNLTEHSSGVRCLWTSGKITKNTLLFQQVPHRLREYSMCTVLRGYFNADCSGPHKRAESLQGFWNTN